MSEHTNTIRVVAAVVDTTKMTMWQEDGTTVEIMQGDPRLAVIAREITPILAVPGSVATVELGGTNPNYNAYDAYEKKSGSLTRFFKVAKDKLASFFTGTKQEQPLPAEPVAPIVLDARMVPVSEVGSPFVSKTAQAVEEILANAVPASSPHFHDKDVGEKESHTVVAVRDGQIIGGMEKIKPQITRAALGSTVGMENFMQRISAVVKQRRHSVDELLNFLQRGDLPIADDGSIVIYKVLRRRGEGYVDCHSQKVTQRIGSFVCMKASMVDDSRRNECSNGLHVARRAYLRNFGGDVCVLAKVRPEDVIAVPEYEADKMRVCGYHILFELSDAAYSKLKQNLPFTDGSADALLLGRALVGDHPEPIEDVEITEAFGGGVIVTPRAKQVEAPAPIAVLEIKSAEAIDFEDTKEPHLSAPKVNPKEVAAEVVKAKVATTSRQDQANVLWLAFTKARSKAAKKEAAQALVNFKKASKVGWDRLKLDTHQAEILEALK